MTNEYAPAIVASMNGIIAELEAENARLRKDLHSYEMTMKAIEEADRIERAEALSRTGAVKVKALEWTEEEDGWWTALPITGLPYEVRVTDRGTVRVRNPDEGGWSPFDGTADEAKAAAQADYERRILSALEPAAPEGEPVTLTYKNWRGEVAERTIIPKRVWFGSTDWHPEPQWLVTALDVEKQADRDFALKDFGATRPAEQAVTEAAGEWREVETNFRLKGRRRSPTYFPATGEACEVSGPNCDDDSGYTWGEATILWQNELFVLYGRDGYWPVLNKREHVLFRPTTLKAAMEAGG